MAPKLKAAVAARSTARHSGQHAKGARSARALAQASSLASAQAQVAALMRAVDELGQENSTLKAKCAAADAALKSTVEQMQQENNTLKTKCEALQPLRGAVEALQRRYAALVAKRVASVPLSWQEEASD